MASDSEDVPVSRRNVLYSGVAIASVSLSGCAESAFGKATTKTQTTTSTDPGADALQEKLQDADIDATVHKHRSYLVVSWKTETSAIEAPNVDAPPATDLQSDLWWIFVYYLNLYSSDQLTGGLIVTAFVDGDRVVTWTCTESWAQQSLNDRINGSELLDKIQSTRVDHGDSDA
jgi:hypothetical protein